MKRHRGLFKFDDWTRAELTEAILSFKARKATTLKERTLLLHAGGFYADAALFAAQGLELLERK
jgi:hypothetical protein